MRVRRALLVAGSGAIALYFGNLFETGFDGAYAVAGLVCLAPTLPLLGLAALAFPGRWWLVALSAAWGALGAGWAAGFLNGLATDYAFAHLQMGAQYDVFTAGGAALGEELLKLAGAGVLLAVVARSGGRLLIAGLLLGAAAGIGFNYSESVQYVGDQYHSGGLAAAAAELLSRQVVGAIAGHPSYTALAGAGLALGIQRRGVLGILYGLAGIFAAVGAHFAWDAWGISLPSPDGAAGTLVSAVEALAFDGISLGFAGLLLWLGIARGREARLGGA